MSDPRIDNPMWLVRPNPHAPKLTEEDARVMADFIANGPDEIVIGSPVQMVNIGALAARIERATRGAIGTCADDLDFTDETHADRDTIQKDYQTTAWDKGKSFSNAARIARTVWIEQLLAQALLSPRIVPLHQPSTPGKELDSCDAHS